MKEQKEQVREDLNRLEHIVSLIEKVDELVESKDEKDSIVASKLIQDIGEAASKVSESVKLEFPHIPWSKMVTTRNHIVHNYFGFDMEVVWDVVETKLDELKKQVIDAIKILEGRLQ